MSLLTAPTDPAVEWSVLSHMLRRPEVIGEIVGVPLERGDFSSADTQLVFATTVERYFASETIDPLIVGNLIRVPLAQYWNVEVARVPELLDRRVHDAAVHAQNVLEHAEMVKQLAAKRRLMNIYYEGLSAIAEGKLSPEEIGDASATEITQVTAGSVRRTELRDWMDKGREGARQLKRLQLSRQQGIEIGAYTGLSFIDKHTRGIAPGELAFIASEPGAGKTALAWACAMGFAERQLKRRPKHTSALVLSMEMSLYASFLRTVQTLTGIDGVRLREGDFSDAEYQHVLRTWKAREDVPILYNFASNFRLSQMRALIAEGIRKYNVGFVVIDHFRMIDADRQYTNMNDADEAKVRFIKEGIAKDLNVAVMVLAHTSKIRERATGEQMRPRLSDLRGSGMISAFADQVALLWNPYKYATEDERLKRGLLPSMMDIDWSKNRFGTATVDHYMFDAATMRVRP